MFCKYCATKLGQEISQKCPNCGLVIDVNDGGQSFYEDADLLAWSMTNEEAMASMPKTEVRRIVHQKPPRGGMSAAKGKSKQVNNNTFANPEMPFVDDGKMSVVKIGIICIAAVVTVALAAWLIISSIEAGSFKTKTDDKTSNTKNEQDEVPIKNEFYTLVGMVGETTTVDNGEEPKDEKTNEEEPLVVTHPDGKTPTSVGNYVTLYVYDGGNVKNYGNDCVLGRVELNDDKYKVYLAINELVTVLPIKYNNYEKRINDFQEQKDCDKEIVHLCEVNIRQGTFKYYYYDVQENIHREFSDGSIIRVGSLDCIETSELEVFGYGLFYGPQKVEDGIYEGSHKIVLQKVN